MRTADGSTGFRLFTSVTAKGLSARQAGLASAVLCLFIITVAASAQESGDEPVFNPADLTAAASHIEVMPEYNQADEYSASLLRFIYDLDWAEGKYSITTEVPYGEVDFDDGKTGSGLGDIRLRYFHRLIQAENPEAKLQNMVFSLDAFLPTGDSGEGLGLGTFLLAPTLIFNLPLSERWSFYPTPKFKFSTSKTEARSSAFPPGKNPIPGREEEEYIRAFEIETYFSYMSPKVWWIFFDPIIEWDLLPEPDEDNYEATFKSQIGKMWGRWGLGLEGTFFVAGEKTQDYQARVIFFYYF